MWVLWPRSETKRLAEKDLPLEKILRAPLSHSSSPGDTQFFFTAVPPSALLAKGRKCGVTLPEE